MEIKKKIFSVTTEMWYKCKIIFLVITVFRQQVTLYQMNTEFRNFFIKVKCIMN